MIDDYQQVVARAFVEPYTPELRALVRVCGDHLEQHGEPRGTLIALAEARLDARGAAGYALQREVDQHVLAFHTAELGDARALVKPRTLELAWRCGQLFGAYFDARRIARGQLRDAVLALLGAPAAATLRRLTIRVLQARDLDTVDLVLLESEPAPPLEQLLVLTAVRPRGLSPVVTSNRLEQRYPRLFCYGRDAALRVLALPHDTTKLAARLAAITAPLDEDTRTLLGRCLVHGDASVREAALARVIALGEPTGIYAELLGMLLQPEMGLGHTAAIIAALHAIGPAARSVLPILERVVGRTRHYDAATRQAAGSLVASLRGS